MDFYRILTRETKDKQFELYPDFIVGRSQDLMVQGRTFYAIWDEEQGLWSRDEYDVQRLVDDDLRAAADRLKEETGVTHQVKSLRSFGSNSWAQFRKYLAHISDNHHPLDNKLVFANTEVKKSDYASKRLPYALEEGDTSAWDEMLSVLYSPEERAKIEWAIGSIVSGDSKRLQKFFVFYGPPGTGKSTILNIIQRLFEGYTTAFDGKALGNSNAAFATEVFKHNPLVAIQHDGDLSRLEDNARLNSIISHEEMTMNEKYKPSYSSRVDALLFVGSNQPVRISDAKSGIIRRLVDIHPTGVKLEAAHYFNLMSQIEFELGAIAHRCLSVYTSMGKHYYSGYRPLEMMLQTDIFYNFIEAHFDIFKKQGYTTIKQAYALYKEFCSESGIERPLPQYKVREELRNYFDSFSDRGEVDGEPVRSLYQGFSADRFKAPTPSSHATTSFELVLDETGSVLDQYLADHPAQLSKPDGSPLRSWRNVKTKLKDLDTAQLHWVRVPENHVVIDFDLKGSDDEKSLHRNLEAAAGWPPTYAEISKSGSGVHLHYEYTGSVDDLAPEYAPGVEVKVYRGDAALRRMLSRCNAVPVAQISSGLPLKNRTEKMLSAKTITSERGLRAQISRNLRKEIHAGTKPSVDFIHRILEDAYSSGLKYDVSDMQTTVLAFANNSSNQAQAATKVVQSMKFKSEPEVSSDADQVVEVKDDRLVFFDVESYPNLFVICWKFHGDERTVRMINPKPHEVEALFALKLVGFYCRRYDNHMLYAAAMGATVAQLFELSKRLVDGQRSAPFGAAYNLSYADIWDYASKKQSLKKWQIDLGILHMELDLPWDQPVDEKFWPQVVDYCVNDVKASEATFEATQGDFVARQILAELSGLAVNDTTQRHTAKIIFGDERFPQKQFVYTDLATEFPGYEFTLGKSSYKGEDPGEGGYVYAEPGLYHNVAVLDVASMHPTSIQVLNLFGPFTERYAALTEARVAIKRADYEKARTVLDGRLQQFLSGAEDDPDTAKALAYALKIVVNIVYGLTSAKFDNPFRDNRNVDNIVAKRGALFMIDLKYALQDKGAQVVHIKTDSVKIPDATPELIQFVIDFGQQYGYDFEHEVTYDRFCLVNDAVYVARKGDEWDAVGAQFQQPYVFKTLFGDDKDITFDDLRENRSVNKGKMYLDREGTDPPDFIHMRHIGKTGQFIPVTEGGGKLYRVNEVDGEMKYYAVAGTSGHLWMEADVAEAIDGSTLEVDWSYYAKLEDKAIKTIEQFGSMEDLLGGN